MQRLMDFFQMTVSRPGARTTQAAYFVMQQRTMTRLHTFREFYFEELRK